MLNAVKAFRILSKEDRSSSRQRIIGGSNGSTQKSLKKMGVKQGILLESRIFRNRLDNLLIVLVSLPSVDVLFKGSDRTAGGDC